MYLLRRLKLLVKSMVFDGSEKLIGRGAQADVVSYRGYAYKIYKPSYPAEWIAFEKDQQRAVNMAGLSSIRYYDTDDDHIVKMDLIEGETLETRASQGDLTCFDILADSFAKIHSTDITGIRMPRIDDTACMSLSIPEKEEVLPILRRLSDRYSSCICHLDMHFLNIMVSGSGELHLIDWMNARIAPAVFDYARTYVIFDEFSAAGLEVYRAKVLPRMRDEGIEDDDLADAVRACYILRQHEKGQG